MILPLVVLLGTILVMFVSWGFPFQNIPGSKIRIALTSRLSAGLYRMYDYDYGPEIDEL